MSRGGIIEAVLVLASLVLIGYLIIDTYHAYYSKPTGYGLVEKTP